MARETVVTPQGVAIYPKISAPDTFGPKADGKYKTDIGFTVENAKTLKAAVETLAADSYGKRKIVWRKNAEGNGKFTLKQQEDGSYSIRASSQYKPLIVDSRNNKLGENVKIGGGSVIRLVLGVNFYDETKTSVNVSFYLNQVQVVKLVEYQAGSGKSAFDTIDDGFVADPQETADKSDTSEDTDNSGAETAFDAL